MSNACMEVYNSRHDSAATAQLHGQLPIPWLTINPYTQGKSRGFNPLYVRVHCEKCRQTQEVKCKLYVSDGSR